MAKEIVGWNCFSGNMASKGIGVPGDFNVSGPDEFWRASMRIAKKSICNARVNTIVLRKTRNFGAIENMYHFDPNNFCGSDPIRWTGSPRFRGRAWNKNKKKK